MTALSAQALSRWLVVRRGYAPLSQLIARLGEAEGIFDAAVGRFDGADLRVHAFLVDQGGDPGLGAVRAEALRRALQAAEPLVSGRTYGAVWVLCAGPARAAQLRSALFGFQDGHFLSKTLVGRGVLAPGTGAAWEGRAPADPPAGELAQGGGEPDPGEGLAELALQTRDRDERAARRMLAPGPTPLTWVLLGLNVLYYILQLLVARQLGQGPQHLDGDAARDVADMALGMNVPALTLRMGQWWRIASSAFMHANAMHLAVNMAALFSLGTLVERLAGPWRTALLYVICIAGSGLLSAALNPWDQPSLGASGAILGLAGVLLAPRWRAAHGFPEGLARRLHSRLLPSVILTFALGLGLAFTQGPVRFDNAAHFGGLISGFSLGLLWPTFLVRSGRGKA